MKKILICLVFLPGCWATWGQYPPSPTFFRDEVYCWHQNENERWIIHGLASSCPGGAPYNWRSPQLKGN